MRTTDSNTNKFKKKKKPSHSPREKVDSGTESITCWIMCTYNSSQPNLLFIKFLLLRPLYIFYVFVTVGRNPALPDCLKRACHRALCSSAAVHGFIILRCRVHSFNGEWQCSQFTGEYIVSEWLTLSRSFSLIHSRCSSLDSLIAGLTS